MADSSETTLTVEITRRCCVLLSDLSHWKCFRGSNASSNLYILVLFRCLMPYTILAAFKTWQMPDSKLTFWRRCAIIVSVFEALKNRTVAALGCRLCQLYRLPRGSHRLCEATKRYMQYSAICVYLSTDLSSSNAGTFLLLVVKYFILFTDSGLVKRLFCFKADSTTSIFSIILFLSFLPTASGKEDTSRLSSHTTEVNNLLFLCKILTRTGWRQWK